MAAATIQRVLAGVTHVGGRALTAIAMVAITSACSGGAVTQAAAAAVLTTAAVARTAQRRAEGRCFTPCTHDTHCNPESGLCEPGDDHDATPDPDLEGNAVAPLQLRAPPVDGRAEAAPPERDRDSSEVVAFVCTVDDDDEQIVHAYSRDGARQVCLAWNDVDPATDACTCQRQATARAP